MWDSYGTHLGRLVRIALIVRMWSLVALTLRVYSFVLQQFKKVLTAQLLKQDYQYHN